VLYFFTIEFRQMYLAGFGKYLASPWNYLDNIPLVLITLSLFFRTLDLEPQYERPLNAVACFFMWIKFLYFWRLFRKTSKFISMIVAIIGDLKVFLLVFLVTLTAFGNALYIMSNNNPVCDAECEQLPPKERPPGRFIGSFFDSIFFAYRMSLGDFDTGDLGSVNFLLVIVTFVVATLFLTIMMLNILIAVISDSYARVESTSLEEMYKNFADLIAENEYLVKNQRLEEHDAMGDYLYIAQLDQTDGAEGEAWEGKLEDVKKGMVQKTEAIETVLREAQRNILNQVHLQADQYVALFREMNAKNEQNLQHCTRKLDTHHTKGRSSGNINQFGKQVEEEKSRSPVRKQGEGNFFTRQLNKAKDYATQAISEVNPLKTVSNQPRRRGVTQKKTVDI